MKNTTLKALLIMVVVLLSIAGKPLGDLQAKDFSGLNLKLYGSDAGNSENVYALESDPRDPAKNYVIPLMLVLKNTSGQLINAKRGFSQVELHRSLKVVDPCGTPLELPPDVEFVYDAGKPRFVGDRALVPAEVLGADFARTLKIDDLRELFPVMYLLPGAYKVSAQLKGARFFVTEYDEEHGLQGVSNHRSNWFGIIDAGVGSIEPPETELTMVILPARGARVKLKLEQQILQTIQPLFGIPIKVFAGSITGDPADVWTEADLEAVLSGITETNGEVTWECNLCIPQSTYTIVLKIADQFQQFEIPEADIRWGEGCSGEIVENVIYEEPVVVAGDFSVFALNSIWLRPRAVIHSGNVGVQGASSGPHLKKGVEIYVDRRAQTKKGVKLIGDSIYIAKRAKVFDVHYNELENRGVIQGEEITPLELPVWEGPEFSIGGYGSEDVQVGYRKSRTIEPGDYEDVKVKPRGQLILTGGTYQFKSLSLNYLASVKCLAPTIILVKNRFYSSLKTYVGPDPNSALSAKDLIIYIDGQNGGSGKPVSLPMAGIIGLAANIKANMFAPNGTLWIGAASKVEGAFVAKDVVVGMGADVKLDTVFQ
jgi:hypothetical protein